LDKEENVYNPNKECFDIDTKTYSWTIGNKSYDVHVWIYKTLDDLYSGYTSKSKTRRLEAVGLFNSGNKNGTFIGVIKIAKSHLTRETIIHESFHAGIELQRHLGRHISTRFEEDIVSASALLANQLIDDLNDLIIEE
jgi:hypothetical protein